MADIAEVTHDMDVCDESQDSQRTIEYTLENTNENQSADTETERSGHVNEREVEQEENMEVDESANVQDQESTEQKEKQNSADPEKSGEAEINTTEDGNEQTNSGATVVSTGGDDSPTQGGRSEDTGQVEAVEGGGEDKDDHSGGEKDITNGTAIQSESTGAERSEGEGGEPNNSETGDSEKVSKQEGMVVDKGEKNDQKVSTKGTAAVGRSDKKVSKKTQNSKETVAAKDSDSDWSDDDWSRPWSKSDTQLYREGYPGKRDNPSLNRNYEFYTNRLPSNPNGDYIDRIHETWWGDYELLEMHHGYIQWLFPIRESGMNWSAQELQLHEIESICGNAMAHKRVLTSYEMMLDFYGMKLKDRENGEIERADNWKNRFRHLNRSMHNYLRITRILKCLGELKYEHLKANFIRFVLHEAIVAQTLRNTLNSCLNYWLEVVRDRKQRKELKCYADELRKSKSSKGREEC